MFWYCCFVVYESVCYVEWFVDFFGDVVGEGFIVDVFDDDVFECYVEVGVLVDCFWWMFDVFV